MKTTVQIAEHNQDLFNARIAELNKKAIKLGLPQITTEVSLRYQHCINEELALHVSMLQIEIVSPDEFQIPGFTVLGTLKLMENGSLSFGSERIDGNYRRFTVQSNTCEHCNTNRPRATMIVLEQEGKQIAVGSSCVKDFTGYDVEKAARFISSLVFEDDTEEERVPSRRQYMFPLRQVLASALYCVENYKGGFISRKQQQEADPDHPIECTADMALYSANIARQYDEAHMAKVDALIEFGKNLEGASEYVHNVRTIMEETFIKFRFVGIAVSVIGAKLRAEAEAKEKACYLNEHFAQVGMKKVPLTLKVISTRVITSEFGVSILTMLKDKEGRSFKHFGRDLFTDMEKEYKITAKIKEHEEWNSRKMTVINYVKFVD